MLLALPNEHGGRAGRGFTGLRLSSCPDGTGAPVVGVVADSCLIVADGNGMEWSGPPLLAQRPILGKGSRNAKCAERDVASDERRARDSVRRVRGWKWRRSRGRLWFFGGQGLLAMQ